MTVMTGDQKFIDRHKLIVDKAKGNQSVRKVVHVEAGDDVNFDTETNKISETEKKRSNYDFYMERVYHAEELLREKIAESLPDHPDRAKEYNDLLNVSKNLTKITPHTMSDQLFESKSYKYERKVQVKCTGLMFLHGYYTVGSW